MRVCAAGTDPGPVLDHRHHPCVADGGDEGLDEGRHHQGVPTEAPGAQPRARPHVGHWGEQHRHAELPDLGGVLADDAGGLVGRACGEVGRGRDRPGGQTQALHPAALLVGGDDHGKWYVGGRFADLRGHV